MFVRVTVPVIFSQENASSWRQLPPPLFVKWQLCLTASHRHTTHFQFLSIAFYFSIAFILWQFRGFSFSILFIFFNFLQSDLCMQITTALLKTNQLNYSFAKYNSINAIILLEYSVFEDAETCLFQWTSWDCAWGKVVCFLSSSNCMCYHCLLTFKELFFTSREPPGQYFILSAMKINFSHWVLGKEIGWTLVAHKV